jgi:hypothetical protein
MQCANLNVMTPEEALTGKQEFRKWKHIANEQGVGGWKDVH